MAYTTVNNIINELNGYSIDDTTTPSATTVNGWISDAKDEIDSKLNTTFESTSFDIYIDFNTINISGYTPLNPNVRQTTEIRLPYKPIISITKFEYESNGLGASEESWNTLTEGRTEDYIVYKEEGIIKLTGKTYVPAGYQNLHITGTYGYETVPSVITQLATLIVVKRIIRTVLHSQGTTEGGSITVDVISISDPTVFSIKNIQRIDNEIQSLYNIAGQLKSYRYVR